MKKIRLFICIFLLLILVVGCKSDNDKKDNGGENQSLTFKMLTNGTYEVTGIGTVKDSNVVIPSTYKEKNVTRIGHNAFKKNSQIESIFIPSTVTEFGWSVFEECTALKEIEISEEIEMLPMNTFRNCISLTKIIFSNKIKQIDTGAFSGCTQLNDVYYKGSVVDWCNIDFVNSDSNPMFYGKNFYTMDNNQWTKLTTLDVPSSINKIKKYQFIGFECLTSINFSDNLEQIEENAFSNCTCIKEINLKNLNEIGSYAFSNCSELVDVKFTASIKRLGVGCFSYCTSIKEVVIGPSVEQIGEDLFRGCTGLEKITIPFVGRTKDSDIDYFGYFFGFNLGDNFAEVDNMNNVPKSIKEVIITNDNNIGENAFANCEYIKTIEMSDTVKTIEKGAFSCCRALENIKLSNTLEVIKTDAFFYCQNLKTIFIPKSVSSIEYLAFSVCFDLTVLCEHTSIPTTWDEYWNGVDFMINNKIPTCKYSLGCTQK